MRFLVLLLALACTCPAQVLKTVCSSGCNYALNQFQQAVDDAQPGWIIEIQAGQAATTLTGLVLRNKHITDGPHILIRSSGVKNLRGDYRVTPADAPNLAGITYYVGGPPVTVEKGAAFYWFDGIEFAAKSGVYLETLVALDTITAYGQVDDHSIEDLSHDLVFDRCYFHGLPNEEGPRRAIRANCGRLTITNSWFSDIKSTFAEGTAIGGWNALGPVYLRNNHISSSAIVTLWGGAGPNIEGLVTQNLEFIGNHYYRPWKWRSISNTVDPAGTCLWDANGGEYYRNTAASTYWKCVSGTWTSIPQAEWSSGYFNKNLFELKSAAMVLVDGNLLENGWLPTWQSQHGAAFLFNQVDNVPGGGVDNPSATVRYVTIQNNKMSKTPWAVSMGVMGSYYSKMGDIFFDNNVFDRLGEEPQSLGDAVGFQTVQTNRIRYANNTIIMNRSSGGYAVKMDDMPTNQVEFYGNILGWNGSGFYNTVDGSGPLWNAFDGPWPVNRALSKNVVVNNQHLSAYGRPWPVNNLQWPSDNTGLMACASCAIPEFFENGGNNDVGFVNFTGGNYRLANGSRFKAWSHWGRDAGADIDMVEWSTAHAADGAPNPYLDFRVRDVGVSSNSAQLQYTAYDETACTVLVSGRFDYATTVYSATDLGGDRDRTVQIDGLSPDTRYFYRIACAPAGYRREGVFLTLP